MNNINDRRPLKTRQKAWVHYLANSCVRIGITPNAISLASIVFALLGAWAYWASARYPFVLISAVVFIQLRLLSNMLDGLVAIEEGKKTRTGPLYNEFPDRIADVIFLIAAGYVTQWPVLGWLAALCAVLTAYVRALGASFGQGQDYCGPMAKPHRMFALSVGTLLSAFLPQWHFLAITLAVISLGSILTVIRRVSHIANNL